MNFPYLFSPIHTGCLELKNRIVMSAMHLGFTPEGRVTEKLIAFYRRRAEGGAGLIIVGGCPVEESAGKAGMLRIDDDSCIPGMKKLAAAIHRYGGAAAAQLYHAGRYVHSSQIGGRKPVSASSVRSRLTGETPRTLDFEEIAGIRKNFADAAFRVVESGFDAVEILAGAGYLISQFLSPLTNRRKDAYGGSPAGRMRFGLEVIQAVRGVVGPDFPVFLRLAGNDFVEGGNTNEEAALFAAAAEDAGVNCFDVTGGWHETRIPQITMNVPRGAFSYLARGIKSAVSAPVIASNRINAPELAEDIIRRGDADMVTMARALLADPDMPRKAFEGALDPVRHCIACNQGCFDSILSGKAVACTVNPEAGREHECLMEQKAVPKKVVVVGGGPAGMKAACTAAALGHSVLLLERKNTLGGQVMLNDRIPGRQEMTTACRDLELNMAAAGVEVVTGIDTTRESVMASEPDAVIVATGSRPLAPPVEGLEDPRVVQARDLLAGKVYAGRRVVVVGGNAVGLEAALFLASEGTIGAEALHFLFTTGAESPEILRRLSSRGCRVVKVVEKADRAGSGMGPSTRWFIMRELRRLGVDVLTGTDAWKICEAGVEVETYSGTQVLPADSVVLAAGSLPERPGWIGDIPGAPEFILAGDAASPGNLLEAIREGFEAALEL
ncbi:MAG TPA: FAD-dependent oxidoreductase [Desulfobacteraceae bacterium]|nr:FAD-dependent oxidoreductase [Desulfobacteraceae bacterium]